MKTSTCISILVAVVVLAAAASDAAAKRSKSGKGKVKKEPSGTTSQTPAPKPMKKSVLATIEDDASFAKFAEALKAADLRGSLKGPGPFTVLAPSDAAVDRAGARWTAILAPEEMPRLRGVLDAHLFKGKFDAQDIAAAKALTPIAGPDVQLATGADGERVIGGVARIVKGDIACTNGVIHVVDAVLLPK